MKDKLIRYSFITLILVVCIAQFAIYSQASNTLSNDLIAWGFRRGENHSQAILDEKSKMVLEAHNGIAMRK